jgi:hypothetical protein
MKITSSGDMRYALQACVRDHADYRIKRFVPAAETQ